MLSSVHKPDFGEIKNENCWIFKKETNMTVWKSYQLIYDFCISVYSDQLNDMADVTLAPFSLASSLALQTQFPCRLSGLWTWLLRNSPPQITVHELFMKFTCFVFSLIMCTYLYVFIYCQAFVPYFADLDIPVCCLPDLWPKWPFWNCNLDLFAS